MRIATILSLFCFVSAALAQEAGSEKRWSEVLAAAQKEGTVVVAGSPDPVMRNEIMPKFKSRFGITVELIAGRSSDIGARIRTERQAGIYSLDVYLSGLRSMTAIMYPEKMLDPLKPALMLPEVLNPSKWKKGRLWFLDPEQKYVLRVFSGITTLLHINTDQVKPDEMRSSKDLLNEKWKGKISTDDPAAPGRGANTAATFYTFFGEEFVKHLYVDQKPIISRNRRQLTDWLARGTYPISLSVSDDDAEQVRKDGFHVLDVYGLTDLPGVLSGGPYVLSFANKAPHPNAAIVFLNWMASRQALELYSRATISATLRTDVDESFLPAKIIPRGDAKYFDSYDWQWTATEGDRTRLMLKSLLHR
jgi:iron(III) transport system substrate-binding protein